MIDKLSIMGITYQVMETGMSEYMGILAESKSVIVINPDISEEIKPHTVLHEVIHAILNMTGYEKSEIEGQVVALGNVLIGFLRDNPAFVKWVMQENPEFDFEPLRTFARIPTRDNGGNPNVREPNKTIIE